jgi:tetratricopeptide (TPR) repeat protein
MKLESVSRPQVEDVPEQTIAIFSCQRGQQSWEDSAVSHGIFFYHVIKGLRGAADAPVADGKITVPELAEYVKEETKSYAFSKLKKNQSPIVRNEGDTKWYFRKPSRAQAPPRPLAEANRLRIAGELEAAREAYDRAILAEPAEPKAYLGRGLVSLLMDDTAGALADFQQVVRLDPQNAAGWTSLGGAQGRDGKFADAVTSYTTALKITPAAVAPLAGRGAAQVELGQIGAGLRDLNRALKIEPDSIDALYNRARAHQKLGDLDSARRDLERAKALEASGR